jgi:hypothetical protein
VVEAGAGRRRGTFPRHALPVVLGTFQLSYSRKMGIFHRIALQASEFVSHHDPRQSLLYNGFLSYSLLRQ